MVTLFAKDGLGGEWNTTDLYGTIKCLTPGGRGRVLPYMGYIGMCGPKGQGFSVVLGINRVSILAILVINRVSIFAL